MHANTHVHTHVFLLTFRAGIPTQDGGCYLVLDSVTYQSSYQAKVTRGRRGYFWQRLYTLQEKHSTASL
jgi:hypothetical protein